MKLKLIPIKTEKAMNNRVMMAGERRWNPNDISNTNPRGARVTIHPSMDNPVNLPFVTFLRLPINSWDDANQYAVTAVTARAMVIHKKTFAMNVLVTGNDCVDLYSCSIILNPL
jgi:hypothetical protein